MCVCVCVCVFVYIYMCCVCVCVCVLCVCVVCVVSVCLSGVCACVICLSCLSVCLSTCVITVFREVLVFAMNANSFPSWGILLRCTFSSLAQGAQSPEHGADSSTDCMKAVRDRLSVKKKHKNCNFECVDGLTRVCLFVCLFIEGL